MKEDSKDLLEKLSSFVPLGQSSEGGGDTDAWAKDLVLSVTKECDVFNGASTDDICIMWISSDHLNDLFICNFEYSGEKYIIKVFNSSNHGNRESLILNTTKGKIKGKRFPTAELVFSSDKCIITFAESGDYLDQFNYKEVSYLSGQIGHSLSLVHGIKVKKGDFPSYRDLFLSVNHQRFKQVVKAVFDSIDSKLASKTTLCHGNVMSKNLIIGPRGAKPEDLLVKFLNFDLAVVDRPEIECGLLIFGIDGVSDMFFDWYCESEDEAKLLKKTCNSIKFECLALMFLAKWHESLISLSAENEGAGIHSAIDSFLNISLKLGEEFPEECKKIKLNYFLKDLLKKIKTDDTTDI